MIEHEPSPEMRRVLTEISVHGPLERRQSHCYFVGGIEPACEWSTASALISDGDLCEKDGLYHLTEKGRQVERAMFAKYEAHARDEQAPSKKP